MNHWIIALSTTTLAGCGAIAAPMTLKESMQDAADFFNVNGASFLPGEIAQAKVSARVEDGDTMVIRLENMPTGHATYDANYARKMLRPKLCDTRSGRNMIEQGGKIRVEMRSNIGKELPPVQIAHC